MNQINDTSQQPAAPRPQRVEKYCFTPDADRTARLLRVVLWIVSIVGLAIVAGICFFITQSIQRRPLTAASVEIGHALPPPPKPDDLPPPKFVAVPLAAPGKAVDSSKIKPDGAMSAVVPPGSIAAHEPPRLTLEGITSDGVSREAMINGTELKVGDEIDGAKVIAIESRVVILKFGDQEIYLRLP
jgi:hypothetical protein